MLINKKTKTKDILPIITLVQLDELIDQVEECPLDKSILEMSLAEFQAVIEDEEKFILSLLSEKYLFKALGKLKSYKRQMKEITNFLKMYDSKQTKEEKQAAIGIVFPDLVSKMLLTVTKFFHLKSFEEAEKVPVSSYLLIFQDEASSMLYQKAYNNIISEQIKQKNKKK